MRCPSVDNMRHTTVTPYNGKELEVAEAHGIGAEAACCALGKAVRRAGACRACVRCRGIPHGYWHSMLRAANRQRPAGVDRPRAAEVQAKIEAMVAERIAPPFPIL
jgi:hypothetical protein